MYPNGMQVHNAWRIAWADSERAALTPTPPALQCSAILRTWVPGDQVAEQANCEDSHNSGGVRWYDRLFWFLVAGLPVIAFVILVSCCCCLFWHRRKERHARRAARQAAHTREIAQVQGVGHLR